MSAPPLVDPSTLGGPRRRPRRLPAPSTTEETWRPARAPQDVPEAHSCRDGWLGEDSSPAPCPVCRPETVRRLQQQRERCQVCRTRLGADLVEAGVRTHPECD